MVVTMLCLLLLLLLLLLLQQKTMLLDKAEAVYVWNCFVLKCSPQKMGTLALLRYTSGEIEERIKKGEREWTSERLQKKTFRASASWTLPMYMCMCPMLPFTNTHTYAHTREVYTGIEERSFHPAKHNKEIFKRVRSSHNFMLLLYCSVLCLLYDWWFRFGNIHR